MSLDSALINEVNNLFDKAKSVTLVLKDSPDMDQVASSLALYLSLLKGNKSSSISCSSEMTVEFSHLVAADKIHTGINEGNGKNLIISFPYQEGSIEKVSYNIENGKFNLVIESREGHPAVTPKEINYSRGSGDSDLVIVFGLRELDDLGELYKRNTSFFDNAKIVNISNQTAIPGQNRVNLTDTSASSIAEIIIQLINRLNLYINGDIATNLLAGITAGSNNFASSNTNASTFEAAAICLRNGAKKIKTYQAPPQSLPVFENQKPPKQDVRTSPSPVKIQKTISFKGPIQEKKSEEKIQNPVPTPNNGQQAPKQQPKNNQQSETPADWLKPKIYKGSTLL